MSIVKLSSIQQETKRGEAKVLDLVLADLDPSISRHRVLIACLNERAIVGFKKYNTYLETFNNRDPLVDAFQEVLDSIMYIRQYEEETANGLVLIRMAENMALEIIDYLEKAY